MFKLKFIATVFLVFTVLVGSNAVPFDIFTLAQSWPQSTCWDINKLWSKVATASCSPCKMPSDKQSWTIHGLWPSKLQGKQPKCPNVPKFNVKLLNNQLQSELNKKWPSYDLKRTNADFWGYEWSKHGTCSIETPGTDSLPNYFQKSVRLLDQQNAGRVLANSGIAPGRDYPYQEIVSALENTLRKNVYVRCVTNSASGQQYLQEIRICFDKSYRLTDCNVGGSKTNCKTGQNLVYAASLNYKKGC